MGLKQRPAEPINRLEPRRRSESSSNGYAHFQHGRRGHGALDELVQAFFAFVDVVGAEVVQNSFAGKFRVEVRILFLDLDTQPAAETEIGHRRGQCRAPLT